MELVQNIAELFINEWEGFVQRVEVGRSIFDKNQEVFTVSRFSITIHTIVCPK